MNTIYTSVKQDHNNNSRSEAAALAPTCFHGRERHRKQSCNGEGWGQSWRRSPPSPADRSGNTNVGGSHGRRSERSTRLRQTPGRD